MFDGLTTFKHVQCSPPCRFLGVIPFNRTHDILIYIYMSYMYIYIYIVIIFAIQTSEAHSVISRAVFFF